MFLVKKGSLRATEAHFSSKRLSDGFPSLVVHFYTSSDFAYLCVFGLDAQIAERNRSDFTNKITSKSAEKRVKITVEIAVI